MPLVAWTSALVRYLFETAKIGSVLHSLINLHEIQLGANLEVVLSERINVSSCQRTYPNTVITQAISGPHPSAPSPKKGEEKLNHFKVSLPAWERD